MALVVELRFAPLPYIGALAVHYWFVVYDEAGGASYGHVHCNLKAPQADVGGGPSRRAALWHGDEARRIAAVLAEPERYPHGHRYRYWPGPNSNSYVAWVLRRAGIEYALGWRGIGGKWRS
ncbi:MAG: DUF3750 domain-containing protein [Betaproteobacteria bacterium]|nr:MAG: DUF3750 domain-containing protein [Betaproteobacteria bacterium]